MQILNLRRWALALTGLFTLLLCIMSPAQALPPGGASSNTPGTSSTISPATLKAGDTLSFTLSGFPANEQVYIKIDDGEACPSDAAQGACVVHQQKSDSRGNVSGSFILPTDLAEGEHTLRFLATAIKKDSSGQQIGTEGYSNRSPVFTVTGINENSQGATYTNVDSAIINQIEEDLAASASNNNQNPSTSSSSGSTGPGVTVVVENEKEVYLDASGKEISKEEYDALLAAANSSGTTANTSAAEEKATTAQAITSTSPSPQASKTGPASPTAGSTASSPVSQVAGTASEATSGKKETSVPWVGITALTAALLAAGIIIWRRRTA